MPASVSLSPVIATLGKLSLGGGWNVDYEHVEVKQASGEVLKVLGIAEARWYNSSLREYMAQARFTETTDLRDLDRLLVLELMIHRWSAWLISDADYEGGQIDEEVVRKSIKEYSLSINQLKDAMGLTRKARDDAANAGDFSKWFSTLLVRAEAFGIHREDQLQVALAMMNEISSVVGTFDRCDTEEREKTGFKTEADIVAWLREFVIPEYHRIDAHFLDTEQKMWREDGPRNEQ